MKNKLTLATLIILIMLCSSPSGFCQEKSKSNYLIGPGDKIEISVWNHPDMTKIMSVRPDGWINYPLAGEISAAGNKPDKLSKNLEQKLSRYIKNPQVSVIVLDYKSKKIMILGEVKKPGLYQFEGGLTVFNALGLAGGYNKHAELKSILVVRNASSKKPKFYLASLYKTIHDETGANDVLLQPDDIVYVPQNFIGNLGDFMDYFLTRIQPSAQSYQAIK